MIKDLDTDYLYILLLDKMNEGTEDAFVPNPDSKRDLNHAQILKHIQLNTIFAEIVRRESDNNDN